MARSFQENVKSLLGFMPRKALESGRFIMNRPEFDVSLDEEFAKIELRIDSSSDPLEEAAAEAWTIRLRGGKAALAMAAFSRKFPWLSGAAAKELEEVIIDDLWRAIDLCVASDLCEYLPLGEVYSENARRSLGLNSETYDSMVRVLRYYHDC